MDIKLLKELLDDTSKIITDLKLHEEESDKLKKCQHSKEVNNQPTVHITGNKN